MNKEKEVIRELQRRLDIVHSKWHGYVATHKGYTHEQMLNDVAWITED